ncbi:MAG: YncE family protein, partial [Thermoplasmata archaeon]
MNMTSTYVPGSTNGHPISSRYNSGGEEAKAQGPDASTISSLVDSRAPVSVAYTLLTLNGTLTQGTTSQPILNVPSGVVFDAASDRIYVGDDAGSSFLVINGTTGRVLESLPSGSSGYHPTSFVIDTKDDVLIVGNQFGNATMLNLTTYSFIRSIQTYGSFLIYDSGSDLVYAVPRATDPYIGVIDPASGKIVLSFQVKIPNFAYE